MFKANLQELLYLPNKIQSIHTSIESNFPKACQKHNHLSSDFKVLWEKIYLLNKLTQYIWLVFCFVIFSSNIY